MEAQAGRISTKHWVSHETLWYLAHKGKQELRLTWVDESAFEDSYIFVSIFTILYRAR